MIEIPLSTAVRVISPRVTALITTLHEDGIVNAAPYSYVHPLSTKQRLVGVAIGNTRKHTYINAKRTGEFVISIVSEDFAQQAVNCEEPHEPSENLLEKHGLHTSPSKTVKAPRVREARAVLECGTRQFIELGEDQQLMVGEVLCAEAEGDDGEVDVGRMKPLLHQTGDKYWCIGRPIILRSS